MKQAVGFVAVCMVLSGCVSTSSVMNIGPDTFMVSSTADGFRTAASANEEAYTAANKKCQELGKKFMFVNSTTSPTRGGIDTTVVVNFRCLNESDPSYLRPDIVGKVSP